MKLPTATLNSQVQPFADLPGRRVNSIAPQIRKAIITATHPQNPKSPIISQNALRSDVGIEVTIWQIDGKKYVV